MDMINMVLQGMKEKGASKDDMAKMEIALQYLSNPSFREKLNDWVFEQTYKR